jgi:hypothetical protein
MPDDLQRIVGIRFDGSRRVLVTGISKATAAKVLAQLVPRVFAEVLVEPDSGESASPGLRPANLSPASARKSISG